MSVWGGGGGAYHYPLGVHGQQHTESLALGEGSRAASCSC